MGMIQAWEGIKQPKMINYEDLRLTMNCTYARDQFKPFLARFQCGQVAFGEVTKKVLVVSEVILTFQSSEKELSEVQDGINRYEMVIWYKGWDSENWMLTGKVSNFYKRQNCKNIGILKDGEVHIANHSTLVCTYALLKYGFFTDSSNLVSNLINKLLEANQKCRTSFICEGDEKEVTFYSNTPHLLDTAKERARQGGVLINGKKIAIAEDKIKFCLVETYVMIDRFFKLNPKTEVFTIEDLSEAEQRASKEKFDEANQLIDEDVSDYSLTRSTVPEANVVPGATKKEPCCAIQ